MMNWMRNRLVHILASSLVLALVAGCSGQQEAAPAPAPAPAAATAPAPAPVDKGAILKEAAVDYFAAVPSNLNMIDAADLKKRIEANDNTYVLVDIRSAADFEKGHVAGAINIPFATMGTNLEKLPKDKQIIVSCYSGQTSGQTIAVLKMAGYNAISLKGGFPSYEKAGIELQKS